MTPETRDHVSAAYWRANLKLVGVLLAIWFLVSFGAGILFVDVLNQVDIAGFQLGFWFAQQGAIYVFVILIFVYVHQMHKIDERFGVADDDEPDSYDVMDEEEQG